MNYADGVLKSLEEMRAETIKEGKLIELVLEGAEDKALTSIKEAGGTVSHSRSERWCMSGGCACNSHSWGQNYTSVIVPQSWLINRKSSNFPALFDVHWGSHCEAIMLVPAKKPQLIFKTQEDHWAARTHIAESRD